MGWPSNPLGFINSGLDSVSVTCGDRKGVVHRSPFPSRRQLRLTDDLLGSVGAYVAIKVHVCRHERAVGSRRHRGPRGFAGRTLEDAMPSFGEVRAV